MAQKLSELLFCHYIELISILGD